MRIFKGVIERGECKVFVIENEQQIELPLRLDLANHSPTGFAWGYPGSGPTQLALAILAYQTQNADIAKRHYQQFKWDKTSTLQSNQSWEMPEKEIENWLKTQKDV